MRKKVIRSIVILLLLCCAGAGIRSYYLYKQQYTGKEWLSHQNKYFDQLETFSDTVDTVVSLYLNNNISEEDLQNHIDDLQDELSLMYASYKEEKTKHPVRLGTDTYETKSGTEAVERLYEVYEKMLDDLSSLSGDKDKFTYTKLIYNDEIADKIAAYKAALICTQEENTSSKDEN